MEISKTGNTKLWSIILLLLRVIVGVMLFMAGAGKVFGWFGGFGPTMTLQYYANMGINNFWAYVSMYTELVGGLLLILGFLTRPVVIIVAINMLVATIYSFSLGPIVVVPLIFLLVVAFIAWKGSGMFSVDSLIVNRRNR